MYTTVVDPEFGNVLFAEKNLRSKMETSYG